MAKNIAMLSLLFLCIVPCIAAAAFRLPESGQTKCYQAVDPYAEISCEGTGQDGAHTFNPMSYTDNGNGTVTDDNTGLMWQKCSAGQNNDATCTRNPTAYNWYQASGTYDVTYNPSSVNVCGSLSLGGYTDWRLPGKKELVSIVDVSIPSPGPTIRTEFFPNTNASNYWSSTSYAYGPGFAWHVSFGNGYVSYNDKYGAVYVRCVRGGQ